MAGSGDSGRYRVNAEVNFQSNADKVMKDMSVVLKAAADNTAAVSAAIKEFSKSNAAVVRTLAAVNASLGLNAAKAREDTLAINAMTASYERLNRVLAITGGVGSRALPVGGRARVINDAIRANYTVTSAGQGVISAGTVARLALPPPLPPPPPPAPAALNPWRDGTVPALYEPTNWRRGAGTGWAPGASYNWPTLYSQDVGRASRMGNTFQGTGPGPKGSTPNLFAALSAVGGVWGKAAGVINTVTGGPLGHLVEALSVGDAADQAMHLQSIMASIGNITGIANKPQAMDRVRQQMFDVGSKYAMTPVEAADMMREVARQAQGIRAAGGETLNIESMQAMMNPLAKAQLVLSQTKGISSKQTTDVMMGLVHQMGVYSPEGVAKLVDTMTRAIELAPMSPEQFLRQTSYFGGQLRGLGVSVEDIAGLTTTMGRLGFATGRGVTGLRQVYNLGLGPAAITSMSSAVKVGMMQKAGILDKSGRAAWLGANGQVDPTALLAAAAAFEKRNIAEKTPTLGKAGAVADSARQLTAMFGVAGGNVAQYFARPAADGEPSLLNVLAGTSNVIKHQKSLNLDAQVKEFTDTALVQTIQAWKNFQALMTEVGWIALPAITKGFRDLANALHEGQVWLNGHKELTKKWSEDLVAGVKSVEQYIVDHKKDFVQIGANFKSLLLQVVPLARALLQLLDPLARIARIATDIASLNVVDLKDMMIEGYKKTLQAQGIMPTPPNSLPPGYKPEGGGWGPPFPPVQAPLVPHPAARPGVAPHKAGDTHVGQVSFVINAGNLDEQKVVALIDLKMNRLFKDPRFAIKKFGESPTTSTVPKTLSVPRGTGTIG